MVRGGPGSYRLRMNGSEIEAEIHTLRDGGLLMQASRFLQRFFHQTSLYDLNFACILHVLLVLGLLNVCIKDFFCFFVGGGGWVGLATKKQRVCQIRLLFIFLPFLQSALVGQVVTLLQSSILCAFYQSKVIPVSLKIKLVFIRPAFQNCN